MTGRRPTPQRATRSASERIEEQIAEFIRKRKDAQGVKPKTWQQLETNVGGYFVDWLHEHEPQVKTAADVTDDVMGRYKKFVETRPSKKDPTKRLSPAAQQTYTRNVATFLNWAGVDRGDYKAPTGKDKNGDHREKWEEALLTQDEIAAMIKVAGPRDGLIITTLARTGIRLGELLSLTGERLIARPYSIRVTGKTGTRTVGIQESLYKRLRAFANERRDDKAPLFVANRRRGGEFMPLAPSGIQQMIAAVATEAEIKHPVYPHAFRHTLASFMLNEERDAMGRVTRAAVAPTIVRDVLGHKNFTTLNRYAHTVEEDQTAALTALFGK